ncbi:MAG: ATP-dependent Clp protease proteolytic subunit [Deltaproteobacteria bacterium]|nr:ATP-dependent Clp protease proteolytic subunit [Deltaproteobacteria bacterium]MCB9788704.1 ATP-dependent Clp protease proteolytic subunit [Deltaproteobacteria bacterium]
MSERDPSPNDESILSAPGPDVPFLGSGLVVAKDEDEDERNWKKMGAAERLLESRTLTLFGAVTQAMAHRLIAALFFLEADDADKPITVVQNSPGGSVSDGFAIYDAMRFVKPEVRIICVGLTASIATITLLGAEKHNRFSLPTTRYLIHQPLIPGHIFGPASDLEITAQEILKSRDRINQMLADATGQPLDRVARDTHRDYWMDAKEALEYGLISRIISHRSELDES